MDEKVTPRQPILPSSREAAARFAVASTIMEGQSVGETMERLLADWVNGAMTNDELMRRALEPELVSTSAVHFAPTE
jgi:hypothetical protein